MGREILCPNCGGLVLLDPLQAADTPHAIHHTTEILIPATVSVADIHLGAADPPVGFGTEAFPVPILDGVGSPSIADATPTFDGEINAPVPGLGPGLRIAEIQAAPSSTAKVEDDDEPGGLSWGLVLLASYASAMTLACGWLLWHRPGPTRVVESLPGDSRPDLDGRAPSAGLAAPIPEDHLTTLGRPLRIGALEWTPMTIRVGHPRLERRSVNGRRETSDGGPGCLILRIRLRNLGRNATLTPLDLASVREPDRGLPDSFIELDGGGLIDIYKLALRSEQSIVGQSFGPLKPGETRETIIVSDRDAADRASVPMTWRLRLRTGPDEMAVVGVRFGKEDLH
jgi:hypothetical protein